MGRKRGRPPGRKNGRQNSRPKVERRLLSLYPETIRLIKILAAVFDCGSADAAHYAIVETMKQNGLLAPGEAEAADDPPPSIPRLTVEEQDGEQDGVDGWYEA
jgi:hypothetical protein